MYSHRQAAWRGAWAVGAVLFPLLLLQLYLSLDTSVGSPILPIPVAAAICAMLAPVFALAFGLGFRLSGSKLISLKTLVITTTAYATFLLVIGVLSSMPVETHAVCMDMPSTPEQSMHAFFVNILLPVTGVIFALFALPLIVAFGVARIRRVGVGVA
jgi:hypothetical protein